MVFVCYIMVIRRINIYIYILYIIADILIDKINLFEAKNPHILIFCSLTPGVRSVGLSGLRNGSCTEKQLLLFKDIYQMIE